MPPRQSAFFPVVLVAVLCAFCARSEDQRKNGLELFNARPQPETIQAFAKLHDGAADDARALFAAALKKDSADHAALYGLSIDALSHNEFQKCAELLCKAFTAAGECAWGELYLEELYGLLPYCKDDKAFHEMAKAAEKSPKFRPHLKDLLRRKMGEWRLQRGQLNDAAQAFKPLQYISRWAIAGPFDNRDGAGFTQSSEPEQEINFEKSVPGRNRRVSWFRPSTAPVDGRINLGELFEPRVHVLAYAVTFVKSDAAKWAVLRAGCGGACAVWVNGLPASAPNGEPRREPNGAVSDYNDFGDDKIAVPVYLHKGWNQLLVKSAVVEESEWGFSLRLCETQGGAATGLTIDSSAEALAEYLKEQPGRQLPGAIVQCDLGLISELEAALKDNPDDVNLLSAYATLVDVRNLGQIDDRAAPKLMVKAIACSPRSPYLRLKLANISGDINEARQAAEAVAASHPQLPAALEVLASLANESELDLIGADFARQLRARFGADKAGTSSLVLAAALAGDRPSHAGPRRQQSGRRNAVSLDSNSRAEAWRLAGEFVERHPFHPEGWLRLIDLENSQSARRATLQRALEFCGGNLNLRQLWVIELAAIGKESEAAEFLAADLQYQPYSVSTAVAVARQYRQAGKPDREKQVLQDARAWAPESPELLNALALVLHREGSTADALALFKEILRLKPNSPQIKDYLAALNTGAGQEQNFYARYDIPLKDLAVPQAAAYPDDNVVNVLTQEVVKLNTNGSASRMVHKVAKLLRPAGAHQIGQHQIYYDPERQVVDIIKAAVITPDGREVSRADVHDRSTSAAMGVQTRIYDEHHLKQVVFKDIEPGSMIDLQYTIRDTGDNIYGDYFADNFYLGDDQPTVKSQYVLDFPKDLNIQTRTFNTDAKPERLDAGDPKREVFKWELSNMPGVAQERGMPPVVDALPMIQATTMKSWQEVGQWYWNLAREQVVPSDEIRRDVAEITKDCKTKTEKLRAIHDWVIRKIRYLGIEFGRNGYKPHKASESYKALYGDCKDTATLITSMLQTVGIDSKLVLIRTVDAGAVPPDSLPMPNLFNHCIAYVPQLEGKDYWIDCTTDFHRLGEVPYSDQTAQVLVIGADGGHFVKVPGGKPEENLVEQKFMAKIEKDGTAVLQLHDIRHGQFAPAYRELAETPGKYERYMMDYAAKRFNGEVQNLELAPAGHQGPMWMKASFKLPSLATQSGERKALPASLDAMFLSARYAAESKRKHDLELFFPWARRIQTVYELSKDLRIASLPEEVTIDQPFGKYSRKIVRKDQTLTIDEFFELSTQRIKVGDYEAFKSFCNKIDSLNDQKVLLDSK